MKNNKTLRWASVLLVGVVISLTVFAPSHRAFADAAPPIDDPGQDQTTCEQDSDPLDFLLCPVFNGVAGMANYLYENIIIPFLKVPPVSTNPQDASFNVWSTFRIYGNIILVLAILIIVFGEVIGGGIIDAYTVKKVLPRILIAAVLINLSVYLVAALVDITNVIGNGIGDIIIAPFKNNHLLNFKISASAGVGIVFTTGFLGLLAVGGMATAVAAMIVAPGSVAFLVLLLALPMVISILAVFVTLVFRQGIILFLVMVSPIAFALYCLPNTERIFKRWWDFLLEALMVYPIVVIVFAVADVLSGTILTANNIDIASGTDNTPPNFVGHTLAAFTAFCLQFAPLFLVPFAFRMASGTLGRVHEFVSKGSTAVGGAIQKRTEMQKQNKWNSLKSQSKDNLYTRAQSRSNAAAAAGHGGRKWLIDTLATNRFGSNPNADDSKAQAEMNERVHAITSSGKDGAVRGITVDKEASLAGMESTDGKNGDWKYATDENGRTIRQFKSAGGGWVDEADVDKARGEFGKNKYAFQSAMAYEMEKANSQEDIDHLVNGYGDLARSQGFTRDQTASAWTGAAYANQGKNVEYKHYSYGANGLQLNGNNLLKEVDENSQRGGTYQMAQQNADTWTAMSSEVLRSRETLANAASTAAQQAEAQDSLNRAARIARTFTLRGAGVPGGEEGAVAAGGSMGTGAAGHTQEEIDRFLQLVNPGEIGEIDPKTGQPTGYSPSQGYGASGNVPRQRRGGR